MLKTYREEMRIQTCHCDLTGQWRPSAILEAMQETAGVHSELLGVGRNALIQKGVVWVLTRLEVVMDRYPKIAETISIETFPMPVRRWFFPRYFIFRDASGAEIGRAGSLWVLLDIHTRKMTKPDLIQSLMPDNSDLLAPLGLPAAVSEVSGTLETALLPRETIKVVCPQKKGRWILTNKRLLLEEKGGFHAIALDKIKSVQGKNAAGNRTTVPANMVSLTVKADKDFIVQNLNDQFPELVKQLQSGLKRRK